MGLLSFIFGGGKKTDQTDAAKIQVAAAEKARAEQYAREDADRLRAEQAAATAAAKQEAEKQAALELFNSQASIARDRGRTDAFGYLGQFGLGEGDVGSSVNNTIDKILAGLGNSGNPLGVVDGRTIGEQIGQRVQNDRRTQYANTVNSQFGPNYGDKLIDDNLVNPIIDDILGKQSGEARSYVERGAKRGIYNDVGLQGANKAIDEGLAAGRGKLTTLGTDIIRGYEGQGDQVAASASGAASGYTLGGQFNLDDYVAKGNRIAQDATANAGNKLRDTFGGTKLFDFGGITNAAGSAQGATNLRDGDVFTALANRKKSLGTSRGVGNQGAF